MEDWRRTVLDNELNNNRTRTLHDWHNVNVVEEHIGLWRRTKKATSRLIRLISARRKGVKTDPHDLERSSTIIRLSESSARHPGADAYPMGRMSTASRGEQLTRKESFMPHTNMNGYIAAPTSPIASDSTGFGPGQTESSVLDPFRATPQK